MKLKHSKKHYYKNILLLNTELSYIGIIYLLFLVSLGHLYFTVPIFSFYFPLSLMVQPTFFLSWGAKHK